MTEEQLALLVTWYRAEFKRRTEALERGKGKIDWIEPDYRVSWTEIVSYAESVGIALGPLDKFVIVNAITK